MSVAMRALDGVHGRPVVGLPARLEHSVNGLWRVVAEAETDGEGQITDWLSERPPAGLYRIVLASDRYFVTLGLRAAYQQIVIGLRLGATADVPHVSVVISPHSYSTAYETHN
jgi:5-hydroxyisourate hydrolase